MISALPRDERRPYRSRRVAAVLAVAMLLTPATALALDVEQPAAAVPDQPPAPAVVTVSDATTAARAAAATPLTLQAGEHRVEVPQAALLDALRVVPDDEGARVVPDVAALTGEVDALVAGATTSPTGRVTMGGAVLVPGSDGSRVERDAVVGLLRDELRARVAGTARPVLQVPVAVLPAPVEDRDPAAFSGDATVHLTFDDGPGAHTEQILDVLAAHGVHATFYVVGDRATAFPETLRRIVREGHRIGNHSWSHPNLTRVPPEQLEHELAATQQAIKDATGVVATAFRAPGGNVDDAVRAAAAAHGLSVDPWSVDPEDWRNPGVAAVVDRVVPVAQPGDVVLLHVLRRESAEALPLIIEGLRARGVALD